MYIYIYVYIYIYMYIYIYIYVYIYIYIYIYIFINTRYMWGISENRVLPPFPERPTVTLSCPVHKLQRHLLQGL